MQKLHWERRYLLLRLHNKQKYANKCVICCTQLSVNKLLWPYFYHCVLSKMLVKTVLFQTHSPYNRELQTPCSLKTWQLKYFAQYHFCLISKLLVLTSWQQLDLVRGCSVADGLLSNHVFQIALYQATRLIQLFSLENPGGSNLLPETYTNRQISLKD